MIRLISILIRLCNRAIVSYNARQASIQDSPSNIREIAMTTCYHRSQKFWPAQQAYLASAHEISERAARAISGWMPKQETIDELERIFTIEEFALFEDICDGSQEAFA
jgi:hypothetical protein